MKSLYSISSSPDLFKIANFKSFNYYFVKYLIKWFLSFEFSSLDFFVQCWFTRIVVMLFVLIFRLCTMFFSFFSFTDRSKFSLHLKTLPSSTLQIQKYDYYRHLNFIISIVSFIIRSFYVINLSVVCLFANSSFLIFSEFKYVNFDLCTL
jgi:hypothetical protein